MIIISLRIVCEEQQTSTADVSCSMTLKAVDLRAVGCFTWKRRVRGHRWSEGGRHSAVTEEEAGRHEGDVRKSGAKTNTNPLLCILSAWEGKGRPWGSFQFRSTHIHVLDALLGYKKDLCFHSIVTVFCIFSSKRWWLCRTHWYRQETCPNIDPAEASCVLGSLQESFPVKQWVSNQPTKQSALMSTCICFYGPHLYCFCWPESKKDVSSEPLPQSYLK